MSVERNSTWLKWLNLAGVYAKSNTGCLKVAVGSVIVRDNKILAMGANKAIPDLCRTRGCLRIEKYGDDSKAHRGAADCRAIHSEIDAICTSGTDLTGATIYVTRYPCEGCARAIVAARISKVIYGRQTEISEETKQIFDWGKVEYIHCKEYDEDDSNT